MDCSTRNTMNVDELLDAQELAKYLRVSTKWVYECTSKRLIPFYRIKGIIRFNKYDIDRWLKTEMKVQTKGKEVQNDNREL